MMFQHRAKSDLQGTDYGADASAIDDEQRETEPGDPAAERMHERHSMLMDCLHDERDRQAENRWQMARDEDYYDGLQWEPEDAIALLERGQAPLVYNKVAPTIRWLTGTERRQRIDWKVLPREQDDEDGATAKTKVLKYSSDVNLTPHHRSAAFAEAVTAGLGWLEDGITTDPDAELLYSGHESWRRIYHDSRSRHFALDDARYVIREKTLDRDIARAMFPYAHTALDSIARADNDRLLRDGDQNDPWYLGERLTSATELEAGLRFGERSAFVGSATTDAGRRESVRLIEAWYRIPEAIEFFASGPFAGKPFDRTQPQHVAAKQAGATTFSHVAMRMRCMLATEDAPLWDGPSWYRHNKFPFTPIWCYRYSRDGMPYGVVRGIRDPQTDLNKRRSKALYVLSTNRVVADHDAVDDPEILRSEAARPDGVILKKRGTTVEFVKSVAEVNGNLEMMVQDEAIIQDSSGVSSELLGNETNADSGKAIIARQQQGSMVTAGIFGSMRLAIQLSGQKQLSIAEQYKTAPQVLRIVGARTPVEWVPINQVDPESGRVLNDIAARQADFIVSEQDWRASLQQAAFEQIGELFGQMSNFAPQFVMSLLDLWLDLADLPNKDEFLQRVRAMNGQSDPTRTPTPQEQAARAQKAAKEQVAEQIQLETLAAQLRKLQAEADATGAQAISTRIAALSQAIEAGGMVAQAPLLAPIADEIARGAGFHDQGGQDPNIPAPQQAAVPAHPV